MSRGAGRRPKNGTEAATERIQIRVTKLVKKKIEANKVDLALLVDGIARGLPLEESSIQDLPKAS